MTHQPGPSSLVEVYYWTTQKSEAHAHNTHTEHVIAYHVAGELHIDHGQPLIAGPGMMTVLPAGVPHRTLGGEDIAVWLVSFCAVCHGLDETHPMMSAFRRVRSGALPVVRLAPDRQIHITRLLEALQDETSRQTPETPDVIRSLLTLILAEANRAMRTGPAPTGPEQGSLVAEALAFIQANCLSGISLKDVAAAVHRAPAHVATMVKKGTGFTVGEWINAGRLSEAAARLLHTDDSMETIAEHIGGQDVTHFIRQFRKAHGITPAAWRAERRRMHLDNPKP
ncbi:MAG: AraC family transcriptional regulator [Acidobacteriota bacterium]|nr:AraC family transcriptional regulator [Acidobacteriota bacterium]